MKTKWLVVPIALICVALVWAAVSTSKQMTITINPAPVQPLVISTASLLNGQATVGYSQTLAATGGVPPYAWSVTAGSLPAGLTLNPSTGAIGGTPTTQGTYSFTVTCTDSQ